MFAHAEGEAQKILHGGQNSTAAQEQADDVVEAAQAILDAALKLARIQLATDYGDAEIGLAEGVGQAALNNTNSWNGVATSYRGATNATESGYTGDINSALSGWVAGLVAAGNADAVAVAKKLNRGHCTLVEKEFSQIWVFHVRSQRKSTSLLCGRYLDSFPFMDWMAEMAKLARAELFSSDEVACVHVMNRAVRRAYLMGDDPVSGKNFDHRRKWMEDRLKHFAANFGMDLLAHAILPNHS
ncbi:MAG: hypothetical protein AAF483_17385 [Planctomycetota bacterium]